MSDHKNFLYNSCVQSMSYFTSFSILHVVPVIRKKICNKDEFMYHYFSLYYCIKYANIV